MPYYPPVAPPSATYITQTANTVLTAEQAIGSLATGYLKGANTTGVITSQATPIPALDGGTGVSNAGTLTNASNTTITGGGTIALGGFTLTVPATGTAALLEVANTFTAGPQTVAPAAADALLVLKHPNNGTNYASLQWAAAGTVQYEQYLDAASSYFGLYDFVHSRDVWAVDTSGNLGLLPAGGAQIRLGAGLYRDDTATYTDQNAFITLFRSATAAVTGKRAVIDARLEAKQAGTVTDGHIGVSAVVVDRTDVVQKVVNGATNASPIVIQTSTAHGFATGDRIIIDAVAGNTAANGLWTIIVTDTTHFSLTGSTGNGAYTSGGIATNRGLMYGLMATVMPSVARGGITSVPNGDDVNGVVVHNNGTAKATDAYYVGRNTGIAGSEWITIFTSDANADYGIRMNGTYTSGMLDLSGGTPSGSAFALRLPEAGNVQLGTTTGTKIGTATSQKLGFFNATPIVQPANTTDLRTAIINLGLLASGASTPLNLNGGQLTSGRLVVNGNQASGTTLVDYFGSVIDANAINMSTALSISVGGKALLSGFTVVTPTAAALSVYGILFIPQIKDNAGTSNNMASVYAQLSRVDTNATYAGTITDARCYVAGDTVKNGGSAVITTLYGFYASPLTGGATNWAFYAESTPSFFGGNVTLANAVNIIVNTSTGTKIGTGTTQKLGFWNATPVAQPAANADTSGATLAALETEVNELKQLLRNVGFMAP